MVGLSKSMFAKEPQVDFEKGYFYEKGMESLNKNTNKILLRLIPKVEEGYEKVNEHIKKGGITTIADLEVSKSQF